ncbi:MAG: O-antigen ligase family protein [Eubacterium sp.]|nr:O-antigen ligase family protein [Eubacterium sp.]
MNSKQKSKTGYGKSERGHVIDIISFIYIAYMFSIYLMHFNDKYFDITHTRAKVFIYGTLGFIAFMCAAYLLEIYMIAYFDKKASVGEILKAGEKRILALPEINIILFFFANLAAFFNAPDKAGAWTGDTGRYFGLGIVTVITAMFLLLARRCNLNAIHFYIFAAISGLACIMACQQHFGLDPFELRVDIIEKQKELFVSLFGNLNTYGSFLAMALPGIAAVFIFAEKNMNRLIAGVSLFITAMGIIPAKSDNVYLGAGFAMLVILYLSIYYRKTFWFATSAVIIFTGLFAMACMNYRLGGSRKHINGLAVIIENPKIMIILLAVSIAAAIGVYCIGEKAGGKLNEKDLKRILLIMTFVIASLGIVVCYIGVKKHISFFVFNDKWGTFRGYIWRRSVSLFEMASPCQKIFGYGNETIKQLMTSNFNEEMVRITNKTYDNCHNELLQYLVTTGLFGMISYSMLFISGVVYMIKNCKGNCAAIAILGSFTGYAVQGTVYLNQPITTPLYFVLMAAGIGFVRRNRIQEVYCPKN